MLTLGKREQGPFVDDSGSSSVTGQSVAYEFIAHSYSSLTFSARVSQASYEIAATADISASLSSMTRCRAAERECGRKFSGPMEWTASSRSRRNQMTGIR